MPSPSIPSFGFGDRRFTLAQAACISGVPDRVMRNWMARGVLDVGERHEPTGRWLFHMLDVVRLAAMHDLAVRLALPLSVAVAGSNYVAMVAGQAVARDDLARLFDDTPDRRNLNLLIARSDHGEVLFSTADIKRPGANLPPGYDDRADSPLRHAHVVVPVYALLADCLRRIAATETPATTPRAEAALAAP